MRGENTPRWKVTNDQGYIRDHSSRVGSSGFDWLRIENGKLEINIAAVAYKQLPEDWQAENRATGEVVLNLLRQALQRGMSPFSQDFLKESAVSIHEKWLERNGQYADPFQRESIAHMVGIARTEGHPDQLKAYRNIIMDLNYVVHAVAVLLREEFTKNMGLTGPSTLSSHEGSK
jgi:hypothetical protein